MFRNRIITYPYCRSARLVDRRLPTDVLQRSTVLGKYRIRVIHAGHSPFRL